MSTHDAVRDFLNSQGAKAFGFDNVGDEVVGEITAMDVRQQTDMQTGEPQFWNDGSPKNVLVITLATGLQEAENDDGQRTVWCRGGNYVPQSGHGTSSLTALKEALRKSGASDLEIGAQMRMAYTGVAKQPNRGMTPAKLYECEYQPPSRNVSLDELS